MNNMFMELYNTNTQNTRTISTRSSPQVDPNTVYPFMCQTIIGSRKPCRVLTKKWSELKPVNTMSGGTTTTIDSTITNRQRYSHYSKNTQEYSSSVTVRNKPQINNLQSINSYPNSILLYFTANVNTSTTYDIVVTDINTNIVVHKNTFKNTNAYSVNRLQPSTAYHISITATDYLGQQTIITLDKSTAPDPSPRSFATIDREFITEEPKIEYYVLGGGNN